MIAVLRKAAMMSTQFVQALDSEIAQLKAELGRDPRYLKLRELERVRKLYTDEAAPAQVSSNGFAPSHKGTSGRTQSPQTKQALDAAERILRDRPTGMFPPVPMPIAHLLRRIEHAGIEITGQNPRNTLSAMLSNSPRFRSHGRIGWTLAEDRTVPAQNTEAADTLPRDGSAASAEPRPTSEGTESVRPVNPWPGGGT
jgi:hypothetical protein